MIKEEDDCNMLKRQLPNKNFLVRKKKTNEAQQLIADITGSLQHAFSVIDIISSQIDHM
jgi:hypothetical protein